MNTIVCCNETTASKNTQNSKSLSSKSKISPACRHGWDPAREGATELLPLLYGSDLMDPQIRNWVELSERREESSLRGDGDGESTASEEADGVVRELWGIGATGIRMGNKCRVQTDDRRTTDGV